MKKKLLYLTILLFIILLFKNYTIVLTSSVTAVEIWLYKVFPFLFIMITLNDLLINSDFIKLFKNPSIYIFIMSLLSGTPSSAFITSNLVKTGQITTEYGNTTLLFTYFANPLFLYTILMSIFSSSYLTIKLMLIHYLSNIIIYLFSKKHLNIQTFHYTSSKTNLSTAIKSSINTNLMVLGAITFYFVLSNITLSTFNIPLVPSIILRGILEVTQGLNSLININLLHKEILAIIFISFGGLSIHTQVKCILDDTNLKYHYFLKGRIYQTIIALFLTIICY